MSSLNTPFRVRQVKHPGSRSCKEHPTWQLNFFSENQGLSAEIKFGWKIKGVPHRYAKFGVVFLFNLERIVSLEYRFKQIKSF